MTNLPDFSQYGYHITSELGHNLTGGRVTYLATHLETQQPVVLKVFQFLGQSDWKATNYDAYSQESEALRHLNHPGIPRYLETFETDEGFCLVQQYLAAKSLAIPRHWELETIKQVAVSVLKILVYLQSQKPSVIHRDIKPENILVEDKPSSDSLNSNKLKVYLVDFGFARQGGGDIAASSMVKGTMGFMPPEQLFNRELTTASDLYGLGMTLICLLTGIKSTDIGNYIDADYRIQFRHFIPPMQRGWLSWLEKMINPSVKERYQSAQEALNALKSIDVSLLPEVRLDKQKLEIKNDLWGEVCTVKIVVTNPIPNTLLSGWWEVTPNDFDPPHTTDEHPWIEIISRRFEGNMNEFQVKIKTSQLLADKEYTRELILHTNASSEKHKIELKIHTAKLQKAPFPTDLTFIDILGNLFGLCLFAFCAVYFVFYLADFPVSNYVLLYEQSSKESEASEFFLDSKIFFATMFLILFLTIMPIFRISPQKFLDSTLKVSLYRRIFIIPFFIVSYFSFALIPPLLKIWSCFIILTLPFVNIGRIVFVYFFRTFIQSYLRLKFNFEDSIILSFLTFILAICIIGWGFFSFFTTKYWENLFVEFPLGIIFLRLALRLGIISSILIFYKWIDKLFIEPRKFLKNYHQNKDKFIQQ